MRRFACLLTIAAAPLLTPGAAYAQAAPNPGPNPAQPDVTVRAPERMVCRNVTRTATRMRASRVCRPVSQMNGADQRSQDEILADAADTLEVLGEKISTNCVGGMGGSDATGGSGPYRR